MLQGIVMGLVVAVPVGPLGLLCISRALMVGPACGLFSGLGVATADALAAEWGFPKPDVAMWR